MDATKESPDVSGLSDEAVSQGRTVFVVEDQQAFNDDQAAADADQSEADTDQTLADLDRAASAADQMVADADQASADRDQAGADLIRDRDQRDGSRTASGDQAYQTATSDRQRAFLDRQANRSERQNIDHERELGATRRDRNATERDAVGRGRSRRAAEMLARSAEPDSSLLRQLEALTLQAERDRTRAASDRLRAAQDRANAARERARLEADLRSAHLDDLTGAYRRGMGQMALTHEIDRARRSDGRFVVAFVDVDRLKAVNDQAGHAAGDLVLKFVVQAMRARLRSFDPIIRYGGDEFVCGLGGTDRAEAERRFDLIGIAIKADARVGISVGFAELTNGDTAETLTERADAAMLEVKASHHAQD